MSFTAPSWNKLSSSAKTAGLFRKETVVVDYEWDATNHLWKVTTHDGHIYLSRHLTIAAGMVGDNAQHAKLPNEITDSWKGNYTARPERG